MIVLAWFTLVALIILAGFTMLGATFVHWYRQKKAAGLKTAKPISESKV